MKLKKELQLVSSINAYITGSIDPGLLIITGKLNDGISFEELDSELWKILDELKAEQIPDIELEKVIAKIRTAKEFQEQGLLNRAMNLSVHELMGDANGINEEQDHYKRIDPDAIHRVSNQILQRKNCSLLKIDTDENK